MFVIVHASDDAKIQIISELWMIFAKNLRKQPVLCNLSRFRRNNVLQNGRIIRLFGAKDQFYFDLKTKYRQLFGGKEK